MTQHKKSVIVIDPVLTGAKFALEAQKRGYNVIGIITWKTAPDFALKTFPHGCISDLLEIDSENSLVDILSSKLAREKIVAVFPGTECSVPFSEKAKNILGLATNDPRSSEIRRNKFKMHRALKKRGLAIPEQIEAKNLDEIMEWLRQNNDGSITWPLVLKPLESAGTDGLYFCENHDQVRKNVKKLLHSKNLYGKDNESILAQSFVQGTEYVVNTISSSGQHKITDLWRYTKKKVEGSGMIYDRQDLLPIGLALPLGLKEYVFEALDALEIKHGPAHCEIMLTTKGPLLIEIASRVQGGINTTVLDSCMGNNQLSITFDVAISPDAFTKLALNQNSLIKHACWINLISGRDTVAKDLSAFEQHVKQLQSYASLYLSIDEGRSVKKTVDLMSCPGVVFLVHEDQRQIEKDYKTLREVELKHF